MAAPTENPQSPHRPFGRFAWSMLVYAGFVGIVALANVLASNAGGDEESPLMMIAGILLGFIAIPVLCVAVPLWLARRWALPHSWLPPEGHLGRSLVVVALFTFLGNYPAIETLAGSGTDWGRFAIHFISSSLFHVPYYPLFAILVFTTARAWRGTAVAIALTAVLFSLYHLAQFHFFPAGTEPFFLLVLFAVFSWMLLLYLFTRSILLVAIVHCTGGAVGMAAKGTYHDGVDFLFWLTIVIVGGVVAYGLVDQRAMKRAGALAQMPWPRIGPTE